MLKNAVIGTTWVLSRDRVGGHLTAVFKSVTLSMLMASLTFYWDVPGFFVILQHFRGVFGVSFIIFWGYFRDFFDDLYAKCNFLLLLLSFYCSTINSNWTSTDLRLIPGYLNWIWTWKRGKKSHFFLLLFYYIYDFVVNFYFPNWTEFSCLLFIVLLFPAFNATLTGKMLVRVIFQVRWWPQALFSRCVGVYGFGCVQFV